MMGSTDDPKDGKAAARTVFGAVLVYAVRAIPPSLSLSASVYLSYLCTPSWATKKGRGFWLMFGIGRIGHFGLLWSSSVFTFEATRWQYLFVVILTRFRLGRGIEQCLLSVYMLGIYCQGPYLYWTHKEFGDVRKLGIVLLCTGWEQRGNMISILILVFLVI